MQWLNVIHAVMIKEDFFIPSSHPFHAHILDDDDYITTVSNNNKNKGFLFTQAFVPVPVYDYTIQSQKRLVVWEQLGVLSVYWCMTY
jgi:hypothetical protein